MTREYAVKVQQRGLRRIQAFFDNEPLDPNWIGILLLSSVGGGYDSSPYYIVSDDNWDGASEKELPSALRDHSEPICERVPCYSATFCSPWGGVVVAGRNSALMITIEESGAHVGDLNGLFVNKPFFRALERFVVQKDIIAKDKYYWQQLASFRKAAGELSLNAYSGEIKSAEALEKAIKNWPPGSLDDPTEGYGDIFHIPKPQTGENHTSGQDGDKGGQSPSKSP